MVRFGIIGCGHIGKRHAEMVVRDPDCALVALCDVKPREILGIEAYPVPFYQDFGTMLAAHPEIDVACICVPNGLHAPMAVAILEKGFHVVIEKPMALDTADARRICQAGEKSGKKIFCVMQNRFSPPSAWLKEMVESGRLGELRMVQMNCYWNRDERYYVKGGWHGDAALDGGTLFTQFSHFIDIMAWLFGDICHVEGRFRDFSHRALTDFEDSGMVHFDFVKGGMGCLNYSTAVYEANLESSITIIGSQGSIRVGGQYMEKVEACQVKGYSMPELPPTNPGNDYGIYKGSAQNHHYVIRNVADVLERGGSIACTAQEQALLVGIIEKIYAARGPWTIRKKEDGKD